MARDYWLEGDMVFITYGKKYAVTEKLRTICTGPVNEVVELPEPPRIPAQSQPEPMSQQKVVPVVVPQPEPATIKASVTDNLKVYHLFCEVCQSPFTSRRSDARYCKPACRQIAHRKKLVGVLS